MLEGQVLARVYSSSDNGFCNESFFESQMLLGGVPSLLLGQTTAGRAFGGYTANGFLARDDYREASTEKAMFVFTVSEDQVLVAANTDNVQYDFFDYAVRFGAGLLGIPMNPDKHIMKANMGTSSCRLPDGSTSVFGEFGMAALDHIEVLVAQKYLDEVERAAEAAGRSFFARLFG